MPPEDSTKPNPDERAQRPAPGSQPRPADDQTRATPEEEHDTEERARQDATSQVPELQLDDRPATAQVPELELDDRPEDQATDQRPAVDLPDETDESHAVAARRVSGRREIPPRAAPAIPAGQEEEPATAREASALRSPSKPRLPDVKAAPPAPKSSGKYLPVNRGSGMTKALSVEKIEAAAPPPVNPDDFFRNLLHAFFNLAVPEKIEVCSAIAMAVMVFMPWQTTNSRSNPDDDTIGLATWGGFWCFLFVAGTMGLFYLRQTGRLPALTPKLLSLAEVLLSGLTMPMAFVFIVTSIREHPVKSHLNVVTTKWASLPAFGSILGLVCGAGICAGAVLCFQRHRHDPDPGVDPPPR